MKPATRAGVISLLIIGALVLRPAMPQAFAPLTSKWANGTITMHLALGGSGGLSDGASSFDAVATNALATWNTHLILARFSAAQGASAPRGDGDGTNVVFFDSKIYGMDFGEGTLAIATGWSIVSTGKKVESDVVFNTKFMWDSYRGPQRSGPFDFQRVALHEFGHTLGLDHPDENGQSVDAIMNSTAGDRDSLSADDIAGAVSLYGGGVTSNISFPPRNEPNDFMNQLIGVYRDELRAAESTSYVDPEGVVVWLIEYARYRVGLCDHSTASSRVFLIIDGGGTLGVCALTPAGPIPFPPRDQGYQFMLSLDDKYRDGLGRAALGSFVDKEGAVVWVLEYLRYRLNGCGHGDAVSKVFAQIRGMGIQPVCLPTS